MLIVLEKRSGTHFDERIKIAEEDHDADGKYFNLMLEYYDHSRTQTPSVCYAMYNGSAHEMDVYVSNSPHFSSGWDEGTYDSNDYHVIFQLKFDPPSECQPYSFLCETSMGNFFRLPEDNSYYFGTDWWDWKWSDYNSFGYSCREQHYHNNGDEWIVNGGPSPSNGTKLESEIETTMTKDQIWYYVNGGECIGCHHIDALVCYEECIYGDQFENCDCDKTPSEPTNSPTVPPSTSFPTFSPTTVFPTSASPTTDFISLLTTVAPSSAAGPHPLIKASVPKVVCHESGECESHKYQCRVDPDCRMSGLSRLECRNTGKTVCLSWGGKCESDKDCPTGYSCLHKDPDSTKCMKFQPTL